ncbi:MAG TPA: OprD family porin [Pseudomonas sp.]|uniref:OprD family porin n=1 Tax=Pseudomonas sp. TaxID=306 RepID=UPI002ED90CA0
MGVAHQANAAGFLEDSKANLDMRNFYFNQDTRNEEAASDREWGQGFILNYQSGFTQGPIGVGLDLLGLYGVRLDASGRVGKAGEDRTPGSVFPVSSNGEAVDDYAKLGATAKFRFSKTQLKVGNLMPKLPVVTYNDGRLLPQTFQGWQVDSKELDKFNFVGGRLTQVSDRNSSDMQGMSIAGANDPVKGKFSNQFYYGGVDYQATKQLQLQYYYGSLENFYQQHFLGLTHVWQLPQGQLKTDLRYFYSTSDGKNSSADGRGDGYVSAGYYGQGISKGEVDNRLWSSMLTYSISGHSLSIGYQKSSGDSDFPHINEGQGRSPYLLTNGQYLRFVNAGEDTAVATYAYDFAAVGVQGLKSSFTYMNGQHIQTAKQDNSEWEHDLRIDYVIPQGTFKGVGLTWRSAVARGNDVADKDENRLIVSYSIPLL